MMTPVRSDPAGPKPNPPGIGISGGLAADGATVAYIGALSLSAQLAGASYILFPELGALANDILRRPRGTWARAPVLLVVTPLLTGALGALVAQRLPYGFASVLLTIGGSLLIIKLLRSPIAPAISAGLLPLSLGLKTWWYPPSLLVGLGALAVIAGVRLARSPASSAGPGARDAVDDALEAAPSDYSWVPFFFVFLIAALALVFVTGWRFLLYPPLVVIGFEMFAHAEICPWADRPLALPLACTLSALTGLVCVLLFGAGPLGAACSVIAAIGLLRVFDLHVPPALAVGLLPMVIAQPTFRYPAAVGIGTVLLVGFFLAWRFLRQRLVLPFSAAADASGDRS
jgi:hypothetical protein